MKVALCLRFSWLAKKVCRTCERSTVPVPGTPTYIHVHTRRHSRNCLDSWTRPDSFGPMSQYWYCTVGTGTVRGVPVQVCPFFLLKMRCGGPKLPGECPGTVLRGTPSVRKLLQVCNISYKTSAHVTPSMYTANQNIPLNTRLLSMHTFYIQKPIFTTIRAICRVIQKLVCVLAPEELPLPLLPFCTLQQTCPMKKNWVEKWSKAECFSTPLGKASGWEASSWCLPRNCRDFWCQRDYHK